MSLAERLSMAPPSPNGKQFCLVGRLLASLYDGPKADADEERALTRALADRQWSSTAIAKVLEEEGHRVPERHLRAHRRGDHTEAQCLAHDAGVIR